MQRIKKGDEVIVSRANVKGFHIHPVEYNLALWKTWVDK